MSASLDEEKPNQLEQTNDELEKERLTKDDEEQPTARCACSRYLFLFLLKAPFGII